MPYAAIARFDCGLRPNPAFPRQRTEAAAKPRLAEKLRKNFPASLEGVPLLLPMEQTSLRRSLKDWFDAQKVRPLVRADSSAGD